MTLNGVITIAVHPWATVGYYHQRNNITVCDVGFSHLVTHLVRSR